MIIDIEFKEVTLTIDYDWANASGDNWNEPYEPAHVEQINEILIGEVDVTELLEVHKTEITDEVFANHIDN